MEKFNSNENLYLDKNLNKQKKCQKQVKNQKFSNKNEKDNKNINKKEKTLKFNQICNEENFIVDENTFEVEINDLGVSGEGVARKDGKVVFVPLAIEGEKVLVKKQKDNRNFIKAKLEKIIKSSPSRVLPKCPYFEKCGGCALQHIDYPLQLKFKTNLVKQTIKKIAGVHTEVLPCVASPKIYEYRNKITLSFGQDKGRVCLGYWQKNSKIFLPINHCLLAPKWLEVVIKNVNIFVKKEFLTNFDFFTHKGFLKGLTLRVLNNHLMLTFVVRKFKKLNVSSLAQALEKELLNFGIKNLSIFLNVDSGNNSQILTSENFLLYGEKQTRFFENGLKTQIGNLSFCQVNQDIKNLLYENVAREINKNDVVIDAFSGAGVMSAMIASRAKKVYGLEIIEEATKSANLLKQENNIKNLENFNCDCEKFLPELLQNQKDVVLILDPPRGGVGNNILKAVCQSENIKKIVYVSCNPISLAKNLKQILEKFQIKKIQPFDMFPQTSSVETLVVLKKLI